MPGPVCAGLSLSVLVLAGAAAAPAPSPAVTWRELAPGVEYGRVLLEPAEGAANGTLEIVRADPAKVRLRALFGRGAANNATAAQWAAAQKLAVVTNAGMYATDYTTHVGYARVGGRVLTKAWNAKYGSALLLDPRRPDLPAVQIVDIDTPAGRALSDGYDTVIQNLRLLKGEGVNVWKDSPRRWSEAALAQDRQGRLLVLFLRAPLTMKEFGDRVLRLGLGVVRAMHLEGGPEASLTVHLGGLDLDRNGCRETGFVEAEGDSCAGQWRLPNVLGMAVPDAKP
jgi:hypothetical protein